MGYTERMHIAHLDLIDQFLNATGLVTPDTMDRIIRFRFDSEVENRAAALAERANEGALSEEERIEYAEYIEAVDLIGIIQASAKALAAAE